MRAAVMLTAIVCASTEIACSAGEEDQFLKRSDVVFMGAKDPEIYRIYGATVVSWGGKPWGDNEKAIEQFRGRVRAAHELGIRYCAGAAFRTAFKQMIDFDENFMDSVCRTLDGDPILVPWLWDHKHKDGHPAYWFCTNAPGYRKYLKHQVKLAMSADVEGLHIDDYNGTAGTEWRGGCFCTHCMKGFREYLANHVSPAKLKACGVESLDGFDYGAFLRGKGITVEQYRRTVGSSLPLGPEFLTFQYRSAAAWVGETRKYAEGLVGHPLMLSVNSSCSGARSLMIAPQLSYFCGEVHHGAEKPEWDRAREWDLEPVWTFKLADAVGRRQACTGAGGDWAYVMEHNKPGLVRMWIAQDYAFGHCLMAPHRQWAYTKTKGTHWYQSKPEDYAHLYRFVRRNSGLFDGYEGAAVVALLYSNAAGRGSVREVARACAWLARHNVPFAVVIAGDDWLDIKLTPDKLKKYRALVVAEPTLLEGEQKEAVDDFAAAGKVLKWDKEKGIDEASLRKLLPKQIAIVGGENILATARIIPGNPDAPAILHLLNRNYDEPSDSIRKLTNVKVKLDKALFGERSFAKATLYSPPAKLDPEDPGASKPVSLKIEPTQEGVVVTIPELDLWGIVKLEK